MGPIPGEGLEKTSHNNSLRTSQRNQTAQKLNISSSVVIKSSKLNNHVMEDEIMELITSQKESTAVDAFSDETKCE